jgi:hypothetical protein
MANNKTKYGLAATIHGFVYSLPFLLLGPSRAAFMAIFLTHVIIDRWRLARYVVWAKNWLGPNLPWLQCSRTGYPDDRPAWMSVWLMIIADNVLHIIINGLALRYL